MCPGTVDSFLLALDATELIACQLAPGTAPTSSTLGTGTNRTEVRIPRFYSH